MYVITLVTFRCFFSMHRHLFLALFPWESFKVPKGILLKYSLGTGTIISGDVNSASVVPSMTKVVPSKSSTAVVVVVESDMSSGVGKLSSVVGKSSDMVVVVRSP